jgi:hypothetical protein
VTHRKMEMLTRLGFAARGLMYMLVGFLAVWWGRAEDASGALKYLNGGSGKPVLLVMAVGFAAYALWRLLGAALDSEGHGSDPKGIVVRLGHVGSGLIYSGFAYTAARLALGGHAGHGSSARAKEGAAMALSLPGGEILLAAAAIALLIGGGYQFVKAARGKFLRHLDSRAANAPWVQLVGRGGYAARGIVFLVVAWFVGQAALHHSPGEAGGMHDALASLPRAPRLVVGAGLILFGLFSLVEARHRRIGNPTRKLAGHIRNAAR